MDGPWYECQGPTAEQVRKDVTKYISTNSLNQTSLTNNILLKIIPDSRNDFGSWRGYGTFGVAKEIATEVMNEMKKRDDALTLLKAMQESVTSKSMRRHQFLLMGVTGG